MDKDELSELGRKLASARKQIEAQCLHCGKQFTGTTRALYCSARCKVAHLRGKKKEANTTGKEAEKSHGQDT
jgi:endogenous inhibitor of DNA gyrase (YacG/DUF329 family)